MSTAALRRPETRAATAWRSALGARWNALAQREQRAVQIALSVVALALLWWVLLAPALATLRESRTQQPLLDARLQRMRALQAEAIELQAAPKIGYDQALRALEAATKSRLANAAQLGVLGDRATVTLKGATAESLAKWLAQARIDARTLPAEVRLMRSAVAGSATNPLWDGTVVLALPARE